MTREIKTPADAVPRIAYPKQTAWNGRPVNATAPEQPMFTAAECAQIAEAYGECVAVEMMTSVERGEKWRAKFKEWQST